MKSVENSSFLKPVQKTSPSFAAAKLVHSKAQDEWSNFTNVDTPDASAAEKQLRDRQAEALAQLDDEENRRIKGLARIRLAGRGLLGGSLRRIASTGSGSGASASSAGGASSGSLGGGGSGSGGGSVPRRGYLP